jgi:hypothetical protein
VIRVNVVEQIRVNGTVWGYPEILYYMTIF